MIHLLHLPLTETKLYIAMLEKENETIDKLKAEIARWIFRFVSGSFLASASFHATTAITLAALSDEIVDPMASSVSGTLIFFHLECKDHFGHLSN